jgi:hypothetical protein
MLGNGAHLVNVALKVCGHESAVSTHAALEIDTMVVVANATEVLLDLYALLSEMRGLATGRFEDLFGLLQADGCLWGAAWPALFGLVPWALLVALQPFKLFCGCADGREGRPLFRGPGTADRFDQLMWHRQPVGRVMRFQIRRDLGQQPRRFITRRLDHPAVTLGAGGFQVLMPTGLIPGRSRLLHKNAVAVGGHRDEAQAPGKRFVLGHGEVFGGHGLGQACGFILAIGHHRVFYVDVDLLLRPIGGGHKAVQTRQIQAETHQANAAGPDFDADHRESNHEAREKCQAGTALKKLGDVGTDI